MKRSEMLEKICDIVHEHRRATQGVTSIELSNMILTKMEELGMQAPNITLEQLIPGELKMSPEAEKHWYACWEPENEKK